MVGEEVHHREDPSQRQDLDPDHPADPGALLPTPQSEEKGHIAALSLIQPRGQSLDPAQLTGPGLDHNCRDCPGD